MSPRPVTDGGKNEGDPDDRPDIRQTETPTPDQILWKPEGVKPLDGVSEESSYHKAPDVSGLQITTGPEPYL
jgi:hypothetical protein